MSPVSAWHEASFERVRAARSAGRVPHAWLLRGAAGTAKRAFAESVARVLLCDNAGQNAPCGTCRNCELSGAGNHPDLLRLEVPEGKREIPVESIRRLVEQAVLTRRMAPFKPIIIGTADAMGSAAANALLKTLEEPPAGTVFLLCSSRSAALLATIRSRCQHIDLLMPTRAQAVSWLLEQGIEGDEWARELLDAADGAPVTALELSDDEAAFKFYTQLRGELSDLMNGKASPLSVAKGWSKAPIDLLLGWMLGLGNRLVRHCIARDPNVPIPAGLDAARLYAILDEVVQARRAVAARANLNPSLMLESLALAWAAGRTR
jgi:DNA polymerase III subunit delta'